MIYRRDDIRLLGVSGPDARTFLGGLITQATDLPPGSGAYSALLTPQGKLVVDFVLLFVGDEELVLALPAADFDSVVKRLAMFKLRSKVTLAERDDQVLVSGIDADLPYADGRHSAIRHDVRAEPEGADTPAFHRARAALGVVEGAYDLIANKSTLLDEGLACAIDWQKGCFMGQEVTARMRYRALIKRALVPFAGVATAGQALEVEGKKIGEVRSAYGEVGFAYVRKQYAGQTIAGLDLGQPMGLSDLGL